MTNKNLSQKICEICGIKPRYGVYQNFGDLDDNYRLVTNARKCRLIADTRFYVDDEDLRDLQPIYYPNFAQAENFVKLYELINKQNRTEVLQRLVRRLRVEAGWYTDEIKQSIRETEWVYV